MSWFSLDLRFANLIFTFFFIIGGGRVNKYATIETEELRLPLRDGWKREITVREYSKSGIRGDVLYYAPCGKKFKQYPDIMRVSIFDKTSHIFFNLQREMTSQIFKWANFILPLEILLLCLPLPKTHTKERHYVALFTGAF